MTPPLLPLHRVVSISASVSSHPTTIAMRYLQRKAIMSDPCWREGHYYDHAFPKQGMKLARLVIVQMLQEIL